MSFTLTYKTLGNPNFLSGLKKLIQSDSWKSPKEAYNCARLGTLLEHELKTYYDLRAKFFAKIKPAQPEGEMKDEDKQKAQELQKEADQFLEVEVVIERHKIDFNSLSTLSLTPVEILALEPMLENLPE
jgi:hypothetical protein